LALESAHAIARACQYHRQLPVFMPAQAAQQVFKDRAFILFLISTDEESS